MLTFQNNQTKFIVIGGEIGKSPITSRQNNEFKSVLKSIIALLGRSV